MRNCKYGKESGFQPPIDLSAKTADSLHRASCFGTGHFESPLADAQRLRNCRLAGNTEGGYTFSRVSHVGSETIPEFIVPRK